MLLPLLALLCACRVVLFVFVGVAMCCNANSTLPTLPRSATPRRRLLPVQHSDARLRRPAAGPNSCGHSAVQRRSWVGLGGMLEPLGQTSGGSIARANRGDFVDFAFRFSR